MIDNSEKCKRQLVFELQSSRVYVQVVFYCTVISMAVMHICYVIVIDVEEVIDLFPKKHPKRLELGTLLKDHYEQHH